MAVPFEQIIQDNKASILRICKIYAVSPNEPEDLFQEVIYQIWRSLDKFQGNSSIATWVYRISLNVCIRSKMKHSRDLRKVNLSAVDFSIAPETNTSDEEKYLLLKQCISQLNEADQSLIILYLEELPYAEMATVLGLTENHVAVKMKRIRKKLFDCMTQMN